MQLRGLCLVGPILITIFFLRSSMATYKMRGVIAPSVATQVYSLEAYCMVHPSFLMRSHRYLLNRMKRPPVLALSFHSCKGTHPEKFKLTDCLSRYNRILLLLQFLVNHWKVIPRGQNPSVDFRENQAGLYLEYWGKRRTLWKRWTACPYQTLSIIWRPWKGIVKYSIESVLDLLSSLISSLWRHPHHIISSSYSILVRSITIPWSVSSWTSRSSLFILVWVMLSSTVWVRLIVTWKCTRRRLMEKLRRGWRCSCLRKSPLVALEMYLYCKS